MENAVYREWVPAGKLMKSMCGLVFSLFALVLLVIIVFVISLVLVMATIFVIPLAFVGFLFWNYRGLEITVNKQELQVNYGFLNRKKVPLSEIDSYKPTKASS